VSAGREVGREGGREGMRHVTSREALAGGGGRRGRGRRNIYGRVSFIGLLHWTCRFSSHPVPLSDFLTLRPSLPPSLPPFLPPSQSGADHQGYQRGGRPHPGDAGLYQCHYGQNASCPVESEGEFGHGPPCIGRVSERRGRKCGVG